MNANKTNLLEYLSQPNPELDCSKSSTGANTFNAKWDPITGLQNWTDFRYNTMMEMYGHVLLQQISPLPSTSPPLTDLEKEIVTENTFEDILKRDIMPKVSVALRVAWQLCYSNHDPKDVAEIGKGDHARTLITDDDRYYPDWAGVRKCETTNFGYKNLCPGETKLASKWSTSKEGRRRTDYTSPFRQIQAYCGSQWNVRHGYVVTPEELVAIRVSREEIGPGLAALRSVRNVSQHASDQPSHSRTFSTDTTDTVSSGFQAMSLGSSYHDGANLNIEYGPLAFTSIPWSAAGEDIMTVKLGLWFLHMMTKHDVSIQSTYKPLNNISGHRQAQSLIGIANPLQTPESVQKTKRTDKEKVLVRKEAEVPDNGSLAFPGNQSYTPYTVSS